MKWLIFLLTLLLPINAMAVSESKNLNTYKNTIVNEVVEWNIWEYASTTLGKSIQDTIDSRISMVTTSNASTYKPIFSTLNHSTPIYIRNTSCWAYGLDLTPISVWNTTGASQRAGILISPRHIAFANHFTPNINDTLRFVTQNNIIVERTLIAKSGVIGSGLYPDICIGLLDSDVPDTITFAYVLPSSNTVEKYATQSLVGILNLPCFYTDAEKKALVGNIPHFGDDSVSFGYSFNVNSPNSSYFPHRSALYETTIGGDSGCPVCLIINNKLVLTTTFYSPGAGPFYSYFKDAINSAMTTLGGGYQLTEIDLTGFPEVTFSSTGVEVYNCTILGNINLPTVGGQVKNNIIKSNNLSVWFNSNLILDFNCYYSPINFYYFNQNNPPESWYSFSAYKSATSQDLHSISADPLLNADYTLQAGSPCIDAGDDLSEVTDDYFGLLRPRGLGPDIGAHELQYPPTIVERLKTLLSASSTLFYIKKMEVCSDILPLLNSNEMPWIGIHLQESSEKWITNALREYIYKVTIFAVNLLQMNESNMIGDTIKPGMTEVVNDVSSTVRGQTLGTRLSKPIEITRVQYDVKDYGDRFLNIAMIDLDCSAIM